MDDGRVNAMNSEFCEAFHLTLQEARDSDALVLSGRPNIFCAGLDLKALYGASKSNLEKLFMAMSNAMEEVFSFPRPIIAACSGHAIGGGAVLMLGCDERLGTSEGRFHIHATGLGIPYPSAVLEIVPQALGPAIGKRTLLLGNPVKGSCRQREGWLHDIIAGKDLIEHALRRANQLGELDSASFANTKSRLLAPSIERIHRNKDADCDAFSKALCQSSTQERIGRAIKKLEARRSTTPR